MGLYNTAGQQKVTIVDGNTYVGAYAADGALNGVLSDGSTLVGARHRSGALNVRLFSGGGAPLSHTAPNGATYVTDLGSGVYAVPTSKSYASTLHPPSDFDLTPAYTLTRNANGTVSTNFNPATQPTYTNTIYVGPGGADAATGLTYALRVRSLKQAVVKANALADTIVRIYANPATYYLTDVVSTIPASWADFGTINSGKTLVIEPNYVDSGSSTGQIISVADCTVPSFVSTADANIYVSTYTTQTPAKVAIDLATLNVDSRPTLLRCVNATPAVTAAPWPEINAKWSATYGALWLDTANKKLYVRLPDNRAPDSNLKVMQSSGSGNFRVSATTTTVAVWMKNCSMYGFNPIRMISGATGNISLTTINCVACYGAGVGLGFSGGAGLAIHYGMQTTDHLSDGFNYNGIAGSTTTCPKFYEISCISKRNGWGADGDGSNNGSSCHVNCRGVRVNGTYESTNRVIHDIQDAQTWNVKCTSGPTLITTTGEASANFCAGLDALTGTAKVWLDNCISTAGSNYDGQAYDGGKLYYYNMTLPTTTNDAGAGTIAKYVP